MAVSTTPIMKKFFSNKIESSDSDWQAYLLEVANIFQMFDNDKYDRDLLTERFVAISGRSPYALRDESNFRDEFGAYGTYLGVFRMFNQNSEWFISLSGAARHFLCSAEPDPVAFCNLQLALFQYPNGAGTAIQNNSLRIQANVKEDTKREIQNGIRIIPYRLLCRSVIAQHQILGIPLGQVHIKYSDLFALFNDSEINSEFFPAVEKIAAALTSYNQDLPSWVNQKLTNFKRNFHIFEQTGLFVRTHDGLRIAQPNIEQNYQHICDIASLQVYYDGFESLYDHFDDQEFEQILRSMSWSQYFDGANLSLHDIQKITGQEIVYHEDGYEYVPRIEPQHTESPEQTTAAFPEMSGYEHRPRNVTATGHRIVDLQASIVAREKANREHERMVAMLSANLRLANLEPKCNVYIDLYAETASCPILFEVKTITSRNCLSQIRKGVSQLYEYRYRAQLANAKLCLFLQSKPTEAWVIDYLVNDRNIAICWLVDEVRIECPAACYDDLQQFNFINQE